jgi:hypothetical protein
MLSLVHPTKRVRIRVWRIEEAMEENEPALKRK